MITRRFATLLAMTATGLFLACGVGAADDPPAGASTTPAKSSAPSASKRDACAFVDRAEIEKMAGKTLNVIHDIRDENRSACEFTDLDPEFPPARRPALFV